MIHRVPGFGVSSMATVASPPLSMPCDRRENSLPTGHTIAFQRWNSSPGIPWDFKRRRSSSGRSATHRILCRIGRRHHRRRDIDSASGKNRFGEDAFVVENRRANSDQEKVVILFDFQDLAQRAAGATETAKRGLQRTAVMAVKLGEAVAADSLEFWNDLRSSVSVQKDKRVVISVRRSSLEYAANALFWSLLLVAVWKIFVKAAKKYHWGWSESFGSEMIVRRDRSLGGKEVFVGNSVGNFIRKSQSQNPTSNARRPVNPLDAVERPRSEKEMAKQRHAQIQSVRKPPPRLPGWWPASEPFSATANTENNAQGEVFFLVKVIEEKRLSGRDFEEEDILRLRRLCKYAGARVRFDTVNVRDSLYRAAIDLVLSSCGRTGTFSANVGGERAAHFLAGLADNIGLQPDRAATMVNAAIAARTRSAFLQAWALYVQGRSLEAEAEIARISRIHTILPPDNNSPEMEMVARGLEHHLSFDERNHILQMYLKVGNSSMQRVASEALGLCSSNKERAQTI